MVNFDFPGEAWAALAKWKPDVLLVQNEAYCRVTHTALRAADGLGIKLVTFSWENTLERRYHPMAVTTLQCAALNIYGNTDAKNLAEASGVKNEYAIMPQVGIDDGLFRPLDLPKEWDVGFFGRTGDKMKGGPILAEAMNGKPWRLATPKSLGWAEYVDLPSRYNRCVVYAQPSVDLENHPREQFAPAASVEALLSGVPVVTTDQPAIHEWLMSCPAVAFAKMGDPASLRAKLEDFIDGPGRFLGAKGREWAVSRFSNKAVAKQYVRHLKRAVD